MASLGINSDIYCQRSDFALPGIVHRWSQKRARNSPLTIVHYSHGSAIYDDVFSSPEPKVLLYHNITPAHFFRGTHSNLVRASELGRRHLGRLPGVVKAAVAHSAYSAAELEGLGFERIEVLPYVHLDLLHQREPDAEVLHRYGGGDWVNIICVAHISPHKCIEDCILVFDYFKRHVHPNSRLFLIGGWTGTEAYLARLRRLVKLLNLADVFFTGQVSQESLLAYYRVAHAFLCMSEHEGFCVPLVEAMRYDVPVFAYACAAVPETLQDSGVLFTRKDWPVIAEAVGVVTRDSAWRDQIVAKQRERLAHYSPLAAQEHFRALLASLGVAA